MQGEKRIKLVISTAILLVVALLGLSIYLLVTIHSKKQILIKQQQEISKLESQLDYYENQNGNDTDNKESDIEIVVPGE